MLLQIPKYQEKRSISLIHSFLIFDLVDNLRKRKTQLSSESLGFVEQSRRAEFWLFTQA